MLEDKFDEFDIKKKGFLTYEEYKLLSLSMLKKPLLENEIGSAIFKHDLKHLSKTQNQNDYSALFNIMAENGFITFGSLVSICKKIDFNIKESDVLDIIKNISKTGMIDYNQFCQMMQFFEQ
ncbi:hypothetical protein GVAV_002299 [Gurleya vavrai]